MALAGITLLFAVVSACSAGSSPRASATPDRSGDPSTSSSPTAGSTGSGLEHPTGSTDVVLRISEGGGFIGPAVLATQAPWFTLYGDGTIIARDLTAQPPTTDDGIGRGLPFHTGRLAADAMDRLLADALTRAGLGIARERYDQPNVADAGTTTFDVHARGVDKRVEVVALGADTPSSADAAVRSALASLRDRLMALASNGDVLPAVYAPARYRVILDGPADGVGPVAPRPWPWPDLTPDDFGTPPDPNGPQLQQAAISDTQAAALRLDHIEGGVQDAPYLTPTGSGWYGVSLRLLLPDERF